MAQWFVTPYHSTLHPSDLECNSNEDDKEDTSCTNEISSTVDASATSSNSKKRKHQQIKQEKRTRQWKRRQREEGLGSTLKQKKRLQIVKSLLWNLIQRRIRSLLVDLQRQRPWTLNGMEELERSWKLQMKYHECHKYNDMLLCLGTYSA